MSTIFWMLSKIAVLIALLWALLMVFAAFGIDLTLRGEVRTENLGMGLFFSGVVAFALGLLVNPFPWRMRHIARDPNAELVVKTPLSTLCGIIVGLALVASSCAYVLAVGPVDGAERGFAIAGLLLFLGSLPGALLLRRTNILRLSPRGLDYSGFNCGPIEWRDISSVEVDSLLRSWVVTLHVRDEEKYMWRGAKGLGLRRRWIRPFMGSPFSIPVMLFNISPKWLRRAIRVRLRYFGLADTPISPTVQRQGIPA